MPRYKLEIASHFHTESPKNRVRKAGFLARKGFMGDGFEEVRHLRDTSGFHPVVCLTGLPLRPRASLHPRQSRLPGSSHRPQGIVESAGSDYEGAGCGVRTNTGWRFTSRFMSRSRLAWAWAIWYEVLVPSGMLVCGVVGTSEFFNVSREMKRIVKFNFGPSGVSGIWPMQNGQDY